MQAMKFKKLMKWNIKKRMRERGKEIEGRVGERGEWEMPGRSGLWEIPPLSPEMRVGPQIIVQGQLGSDTRRAQLLLASDFLWTSSHKRSLFSRGIVVESNTPFGKLSNKLLLRSLRSSPSSPNVKLWAWALVGADKGAGLTNSPSYLHVYLAPSMLTPREPSPRSETQKIACARLQTRENQFGNRWNLKHIHDQVKKSFKSYCMMLRRGSNE